MYLIEDKNEKVLVTKEQLIQIFETDFLYAYVEGIILDTVISDLPINEWLETELTNFRTPMSFIYLDFYISLGKDLFIELVKTKLEEEISNILEDAEDDTPLAFSIFNTISCLQDNIDLILQDKIDWFEKQISRGIFESHWEVK